jgi:hypothetical protein
MDIAIEWGRKLCTVVAVRAMEILPTVADYPRDATTVSKHRIPATMLHVVDPKGSDRFTCILKSSFQMMSI